MGDLRIAGFVCAHQAHSVAAQNGGQPIEEKEDGEEEKDRGFSN
jgi:hypothetical protein